MLGGLLLFVVFFGGGWNLPLLWLLHGCPSLGTHVFFHHENQVLSKNISNKISFVGNVQGNSAPSLLPSVVRYTKCKHPHLQTAHPSWFFHLVYLRRNHNWSVKRLSRMQRFPGRLLQVLRWGAWGLSSRSTLWVFGRQMMLSKPQTEPIHWGGFGVPNFLGGKWQYVGTYPILSTHDTSSNKKNTSCDLTSQRNQRKLDGNSPKAAQHSIWFAGQPYLYYEALIIRELNIGITKLNK